MQEGEPCPEDYPDWLMNVEQTEGPKEAAKFTSGDESTPSHTNELLSHQVASGDESSRGIQEMDFSGDEETDSRKVHATGGMTSAADERTAQEVAQKPSGSGRRKAKGRKHWNRRNGVSDAIKHSCHQCGVTKTPLWRTFGETVLCVRLNHFPFEFSFLWHDTDMLFFFSSQNACGLRRMRAKKPYQNKVKKRKRKPSNPQTTFKTSPFRVKMKQLRQRRDEVSPSKEEEPMQEELLEGGQLVRRGKRKRRASVWLRKDQWENDDDVLKISKDLTGNDGFESDLEEDVPAGDRSSHDKLVRNSSATRETMMSLPIGAIREDEEDTESMREACEALASMDQLDTSSSKEEELPLCDSELDLILKLHEVYGPSKSVYQQTIRRKEVTTLTLAIVLRATINLFNAGRISASEKLWLIDQLSSGNEVYLNSLPLATSSYEDLEDLLDQFVSYNRKLEESRSIATERLASLQRSNSGLVVQDKQGLMRPDSFRSPPPLILESEVLTGEVPSDVHLKSHVLHTPTMEERRPKFAFDLLQ